MASVRAMINAWSRASELVVLALVVGDLLLEATMLKVLLPPEVEAVGAGEDMEAEEKGEHDGKACSGGPPYAARGSEQGGRLGRRGRGSGEEVLVCHGLWWFSSLPCCHICCGRRWLWRVGFCAFPP